MAPEGAQVAVASEGQMWLGGGHEHVAEPSVRGLALDRSCHNAMHSNSGTEIGASNTTAGPRAEVSAFVASTRRASTRCRLD